MRHPWLQSDLTRKVTAQRFIDDEHVGVKAKKTARLHDVRQARERACRFSLAKQRSQDLDTFACFFNDELSDIGTFNICRSLLFYLHFNLLFLFNSKLAIIMSPYPCPYARPVSGQGFSLSEDRTHGSSVV